MKTSIALLLLFSLTADAQQYPIDVRSLALGISSVASPDSSAININPANNACTNKNILSISVSEPYSIKELGIYSIGFIKQLSNSKTLQLSAIRSGNKNYNEQNFSIGISARLGKRMLTGIRLHFQQWNINDPNYQNETALIPSAGFLVNFYRNLYFGCDIDNFRSIYSKNEYGKRILTSRINTGLCLRIGKEISITGSANLQSDKELSYHFGTEYKAGTLLAFQSGILTNPLRQSFGMKFQVRNYILNTSIITHPNLGLSSAFSLSFLL